MSELLATPRLRLEPIAPVDAAQLCSLIAAADLATWVPARGTSLALTVADLIAKSCASAALTSAWRIARDGEACIGLAVLSPPSAEALTLRAIGWRSRELLILLHPCHRGYGFATEAIAALAAHAARDGVTFALVAIAAPENVRATALLVRCRFQMLGRIEAEHGPRIVYELTV